jgi:hypothetical protein
LVLPPNPMAIDPNADSLTAVVMVNPVTSDVTTMFACWVALDLTNALPLLTIKFVPTFNAPVIPAPP